ncbi:MAG: peptidase S66 [Candidatus Staskawiczbacteria bacterium RIFOXYC1_FULL_37_43]|nr:MAG: peptidase S66 [Candidatus Staskawiczbacteria bacterium RIFCSPHIGHO2_01_FULL_37_17]OGZ71988.1 MAG: peptidase S66 [Candidatus Staskawiczbacteria bacterium RIFCSPLOWO2_01_FULL_37_19]OGZ75533.1 MAG: peptidase S66 [Candidatus Staskawiczbacteria bacterium RIFOXYA1_FULL_37_15]OGZ77904.1 MAG: peptidase S66 [Candidatus Staskawiczbacteria bacterium RIFOXYA12_FULL_37_10]OGZ80521.1 MAG: peptidase S66 [Candidatus Staskawiczbacteria bacterium RIFOXYB1_FULL_38_37]OGZ81219.1 MAG: peptidase S66 [Candid
MYPQKLRIGDEVRIIAPSRSMAIISKETREIANKRFADLGLKLSFGKHIEESDEFISSSIKSRIEDFHDAFSNKNVKAVITAIGGFNSNQLLRYLDWDLIKENPKIFCGYSDITALNNAILAKTGLVSYSGPHYSTFGQELYFDYTLEYFKKCLFSDELFEIEPSEEWSDDMWYKNQKERNLIKNDGFLVINEGKALGTLLGANLCTFNLLQGTEYFPEFPENTILFVEDDEMSNAVTFDRDLQSLIHLPEFESVKGIVIGRFQNASQMTNELLIKIIKTKKELNNLPVIANVDFGHTDPKITFPVGGEVSLEVRNGEIKLSISKH